MAKILAVIPARYASTRLPGKPLVDLNGLPMVVRVAQAVQNCGLLLKVIVATDDDRILKTCERFGVEATMTSMDCMSGTDRVWEVARNRKEELILNVQGDEPQVGRVHLEALIQPFDQPEVQMTTLGHPLSIEDLENKNAVKVLRDSFGRAIYFSRWPIPFSRMDARSLDFSQLASKSSGLLKHIGLYGYRRAFLEKYCSSTQPLIEQGESLEQLRALYLGAKIQVGFVDQGTLSIDSPADLEKYLNLSK